MSSTSTQDAEALRHLQTRINRSASWFYWIAGLSIVNSCIIAFDGGFNFLIGLGVTQIVDGFAWGTVQEGAPEYVTHIGLAISVCVSLVFALFGFAGRKRILAVYVFGMVLYGLDGLIFLAFQDWFPFGFHIFALFGLYKAVGNMKLYRELKASKSAPFENAPQVAAPQEQPT